MLWSLLAGGSGIIAWAIFIHVANVLGVALQSTHKKSTNLRLKFLILINLDFPI
jgi:hypothetical protein